MLSKGIAVLVSPEPGSAAAARIYNRESIVELALERGVITRQEIVTRSGLSKATVSRIVRDLLDEQILLEGPAVGGMTAGRPTTALVLNNTIGLAVGVLVDSEGVEFSASDARGAEIRRWRSEGIPRTPDLIADGLARELSRLARASQGRMEVTVAVKARAADGGELRGANAYPQLNGYPLGPKLSERLGRTVVVENDADMALLAERARGIARGADSSAYVMVGAGIGVGAVVDGALLRGSRGFIGEFGELPFNADDSAEAALQGAIETGDEGAEEDILTFLVLAICAVYSPEVVVFAQSPSVGGVRILGNVARRCAETLAAAPRLVTSRLGATAPLTGSVDVSLTRIHGVLRR